MLRAFLLFLANTDLRFVFQWLPTNLLDLRRLKCAVKIKSFSHLEKKKTNTSSVSPSLLKRLVKSVQQFQPMTSFHQAETRWMQVNDASRWSHRSQKMLTGSRCIESVQSSPASASRLTGTLLKLSPLCQLFWKPTTGLLTWMWWSHTTDRRSESVQADGGRGRLGQIRQTGNSIGFSPSVLSSHRAAALF